MTDPGIGFSVPDGASEILRQLNQHGFRAYAVGGCVRDSLLGIAPKDWDICTSALPEEMLGVFENYHTETPGLKHGTLTVIIGHVPYEVTTFRIDGTYTDHRHPDGVSFVNNLREDLARRDFTVNAMAYHPETGIVDEFGGKEDLRNSVLRCVGDPEQRFEEDALRILRALRFSAVYDLRIEEKTSEAIHRLYPTLEKIAGERIRAEIGKMLCGKACGRVLREYADVMGFLVPELKVCVGFDQKTPYHKYDVYEHIVQSVENIMPVEALRFTMLLHDAGKPACFWVDDKGVGHAYGHPKKSREIAERFLDRLKMDTATREYILLMVLNHDIELNDERHLLTRRLNQFGEKALRDNIEVHRADASAKGFRDQDEINRWAEHMNETVDQLIREKTCFSLKQLAVNGKNLIQAGVPDGKQVGDMLQHLLEEVMDGKLENNRDTLLQRTAELLNQGKNL